MLRQISIMRLLLKPIHITQGFISLYALLLTLSISFIALHSLRSLSLKKEIVLALYFQKQSFLYATSLKDIVLQCLKNLGFAACKEDSVQLDSHFHGMYHITELQTQTQGINDLLLDISIYSQTSLSTRPLRFAKRYILKGFS